MIIHFWDALNSYRNVFRYSLVFSVIVFLIAVAYGFNVDDMLTITLYADLMRGNFFYYAFFFLFWGSVVSACCYVRCHGVSRLFSMDFILYLQSFMNDYAIRKIPRALAIFICMFAVMFFYLGKSLVGRWGEFYADPYFIFIERIMHFGALPHEYFPDWLYTATILQSLDHFYIFWFAVMFFFTAYAIFHEKNEILQKQVVWSSIIVWTALGVVLATLLSSCGPIFLAKIHPEYAHYYDEHVMRLQKIMDENPYKYAFFEVKGALYSTWVRQDLFSLYLISAMPSIHVAFAWLNFLQAWAINRIFGALVFVYAMLILFTSVYLTWHYALDGYVSIICASLVWYIVGKILRRDAAAGATQNSVQEPERKDDQSGIAVQPA